MFDGPYIRSRFTYRDMHPGYTLSALAKPRYLWDSISQLTAGAEASGLDFQEVSSLGQNLFAGPFLC